MKDEVLAVLEDRSQFNLNGCREWTRGKDWDGYGIVRIEGRSYRAHRVAWELENGPIPEKMLVCHTCDNPPCIEISHLFLGTSLDNNRDRQEKGRSSNRRGEKCPTAKLTWEKVAKIRALAASGKTHTSIAPLFGVTREAVSTIVRGERWKINNQQKRETK